MLYSGFSPVHSLVAYQIAINVEASSDGTALNRTVSDTIRLRWLLR